MYMLKEISRVSLDSCTKCQSWVSFVWPAVHIGCHQFQSRLVQDGWSLHMSVILICTILVS